jgi:hypothetical protein
MRGARLGPRDPLLAIYHDIASYAQLVGCNYDEAMQLTRQGLAAVAQVGAVEQLRASAAGGSKPLGL